ncbi:MAG: aminotransferase class IV [Propioniciclava sp.]|uniref:aminotransferase class IV n=1 Tax=Propioniciclava sp. TaxID=2038686 RepID=UPI0039E5CC26
MSVRQLVAVLGRGVVPATEPIVRADDLGINRGDGIFDAARVVVDAGGVRVDHLAPHLARFARSHAAMEMPAPDLDAWRALIDETLGAWDVPGPAILKLIATRGQEHDPSVPGSAFLTITENDSPACVPLRVSLLPRGYASDAFAAAPWLLGGVKSLAYAINVAAAREAARRGDDDVLFTSSDGFCLEGPRSGLIVRFGADYATTPVAGTGILDSVTVGVVADGLRARGVRFTERLMTPAEVSDADGAWLLSAGRGVCEISHLDHHPLRTDPEVSALLRSLAGF